MSIERNTLVYVDHNLIVAVAAKLIGVLKTQGQGHKSSAKLNWFVQVGHESSVTTTEEVDIRQMLPEDIVYLLYPHIQEKHANVEPVLSRFTTGTRDSLIPGNVVSIKGKLIFKDLGTQTETHEPFSNVDINLPSHSYHGEKCIVAELHDGGYRLPVYIPEVAKYQTCFCHNDPVEVTGIVRWHPAYSPGGAGSLNLAIRCAALWLR